MTSPSKRKGSAWERAVVSFLREHGWPYVERSYGAGRPQDVGDIALPGWVLECKAHRQFDLAGWVDEAETERVNARQPFAAVIAKRRNKATGDGYVVMTLEAFARLIRDDS